MSSSAPSASQPEAEPWLRHVPVPLFAVVMGVVGLGLAWRQAGHVLGVPGVIGEAIAVLGAVLFIAIALLYGAKALAHFDAVKAEFLHPVRSSFFPTISVSLVLLGLAALPHSRAWAEGLGVVGGGLHILLTINLLGRWIVNNHEITHSSPAWFIPVVGNILVPFLAVPLGYVEIAWLFFSVGLVFWLLLFTLVLNRIIFHDQMPARFMPTLFILIAPPAVGFLSYVALNGGELDAAARVLFYVALFLTVLIFSLGRQFLRVPFAVSWWAFTFPLDAMATASLTYHRILGLDVMAPLCWVLLTVATLVVAVVSLRTLWALADRHLFMPE